MAEIISFNKYGKKDNLRDLVLHAKWVFHEIKSLSLFAKLTIITAILFAIIAFRISGEVFRYINYASPKTQDLSEGLPSNCHLAVDFSKCPKGEVCQPETQVVCDNPGE